MKRDLLAWLRCPVCHTCLDPGTNLDAIESGRLTCQQAHSFPIVRGVPRFVSDDAYTRSFSYEWNRFRKTQLDSHTGRTDTRDRLQASLNFPIEYLKHKLVLDVGCGMGRFAEVVAGGGAEYVGIDYSFAVDAAFANAGHLPGVHFVQADLFQLPFADEIFDLVMSLGVLHHTPDPRRAFAGLSYAAAPLYYVWTLPVLGWLLRSVAFISLERDWRWRVLDTFDWYSPLYQSWHTHHEVFSWFKDNGFERIEVLAPSVSQIGTKAADEMHRTQGRGR